MAPISASHSLGTASIYDPDTYSLVSQASSMLTIGDSIPAQLVRKAARHGYKFNVMSVGPPGMNKTTLLGALFGKNLDMSVKETSFVQEKGDTKLSKLRAPTKSLDTLNPEVTITRKTFEIEEKRVKLKLTLAESENYGEALCLKGTSQPLVDYIDAQYADYFNRENSHNRRSIEDNMVHCLFYFISPFSRGLSEFDLQFLEAVHKKVNIVPIIGRAEMLTVNERIAFKRKVREDLKARNISLYQIGSPEMDDPDDLKKVFKDMQDAIPFAICSLNLNMDGTVAEHCLEWGSIDSYNLDHSDFLLLKTMLHMQIPDLCEITHEVFYEDYRLKMIEKSTDCIALGQSRLKPINNPAPTIG